MSHFVCIVMIPDAREIVKAGNIQEEVDRLMAPYMENCCAEPDKMYMKFYDTEDEMLKEYNEDGVDRVVMPDGRLLLEWDEEFRRQATPEEKEKDPMAGFGSPRAPEDLPRRKVPFKETFSTFEEFAEKWHGRATRDEDMKRYGYWQNPNAKWDWYEIGGRWAGYFQLKKGRAGGVGKQYNHSGRLQQTDDMADVCFKNAVDWDTMRGENEKRALHRYDLVQEAIKDTPVATSWEEVRSSFEKVKTKHGMMHNQEDIDKARQIYHDQPRVQAFNKLCATEEGRELFGLFADVEEYQMPREKYLEIARHNTAVPFAVLKDGKWVEKGNMGWWGMASNEKDTETWASMVSKVFDELPGETLLVAVDCHI